ncbi:MAG: 30S ribosomal protein S16 [Bacteroidetes bacterium]|nr:MAG: 30S ribosomal protein S16 [Bacteroidota bacterium]
MAVKLRLRRMGRKKRPIYSVVATDARHPRDGRFIEDLGRYRPLDEPAQVSLNEERVLYWLKQGAQPTDTVRSLLRRYGLMLALHLERKGKSAEEIAEAVEAHRARWAEKDLQRVKLTPAERRKQALEAERARVREEEAEEARRQAELEAQRQKEAEEAKRKAAEERAAAAAAAQAEQEAANEAQAQAEAEAAEATEATEAPADVVEAEAPAATEAGAEAAGDDADAADETKES